MAGKDKGKPTPTKSKPKKQLFTWQWLALGGLIVIIAGFFIWQYYPRDAFSMTEGEKNLLVLLRNDKSTQYRVQYNGRKPVKINSLQVMLEGQILHIDVVKVVLSYNGQELTLDPQGNLASGDELLVAPGGIFDVRVTYRGQTLGKNYMYGFRINYTAGDSQQTYELVTKYDFAIDVE